MRALAANYEMEISPNWVKINTFAQTNDRQLKLEEVLHVAGTSAPDVEMKNPDRSRAGANPTCRLFQANEVIKTHRYPQPSRVRAGSQLNATS